MKNKTLGGLLLLALLLAACGGADVGSTPEVGPDDPLIQISDEGGFVPVEIALGSGPRFTVLGDGRVIFEGPRTTEFPGPLVPSYQVAQMSGSQLNAIMAMIDNIGIADLDDESDNSAADKVADASTTAIRFWDDSGQHRLAVYALGIEPDPSDRNATLLKLTDTLAQFVLGAEATPYDPDRVRIVAGVGFVNDDFEDMREWPLDSSDMDDWETLPNGWQCQVFDSQVLTAFEGATEATTWTHPDRPDPVKLLVRPLLPGETECG